MSLLGLAIVGKNNEPLYLCDCARIVKEREKGLSETLDVVGKSSSQLNETPAVDDPLEIASINEGEGIRSSLDFPERLILHSALDQLEESIITTAVGLPVNIKIAGAGGFLGVLSKTEEDRLVYGYITATNIKILLLADSTARESDIRSLLSDIHEYYVQVSWPAFTMLSNQTYLRAITDLCKISYLFY